MSAISIRALIAVAALAAASGANAAILVYEANMDGPSESPPNASPGTGYALVTIDTTLHTMMIDVTFQDLIGTTTIAHIHGPTAVPLAGTAGVATTQPSFAGWPAGVTSGAYMNTLDLTLASSYGGTFLANNGGTPAGAEAALLAAIADEKAYFNIHTSFAGGGEIRGFLRLIPAPSTASLLALGALCATRRRRA